MFRSLMNFVVPMSLVAALALPLTSHPARAAGDIPDETATSAMARALATSNPTVLSNPDFTVNPDLKQGSSGGAVSPDGSGTENYPPGANGPEATGSMMNGSMMGQAAD
ncbi:MAG TPA: hypothetical protein VMA53_01195 [Stellaceae bacterium]|nr:hypothetical protein [Stellaceae bacterium]